MLCLTILKYEWSITTFILYGSRFGSPILYNHEDCDCKPPAYGSFFCLHNRVLEPSGQRLCFGYFHINKVCPWASPNLYYADSSTNSCVLKCPSTPSLYANDYTQTCVSSIVRCDDSMPMGNRNTRRLHLLR